MGKPAENDIEHYRTLIEVPRTFSEGFGWTTVLGIVFSGLVMMPGGIYLGLMTGTGIGSVASWVTLILFMEIARRAFRPLSKQNLVVLLHAATVMMAAYLMFPGGPFGQLVFRAYLVGSEAVRDAGMAGAFPSWFAPAPASAAIAERALLHRDWLVPAIIVAFMAVIAVVQRYTLGYFFFRLTSDVERLPYPLASVNALGTTALADLEAPAPADNGAASPNAERPGERRRVFSLGAVLGLVYGFVMVGVPTLSGLFLSQPFYIIPQPFIDATTVTESLLPSTPLGVTLDLAVVFMGFVLPFWTVVGTFVAMLLTLALNPLLYHFGVLHTWQPGMDTVNTAFSNNVDFWLSFSIGTGLGLSLVSVFNTVRDIRRRVSEVRAAAREQKRQIGSFWGTPPEGRGDYSPWVALGIYMLTAALVVGVCMWLLPLTAGVVFFLVFFAFLYSPFIAYVNARLLGLAGQGFDIPYVREGAFLLSGARGLGIWLAPIPSENYGWQAQAFRVNELVGVRFWSLVKTELVVVPVLFVLSLLFWAFIWKADAVPSAMFPWAQVNWELAAKNSVLLYSSTFVPPGSTEAAASVAQSEFMKAMHPTAMAGGFAGALGAFALVSALGLPVVFYYGLFRGFGQLPHYMLLEIVGAVLARRFLHKRFGKERFLRLAPILLAGYLTGVGLIGMATIALRLIKSAVSAAPF
ncbi:MAG: peptide transporter [Myxococcota bacterium]